MVTLTDRVDYLANLSNNLVYALAVEKLLQIEIPPRAQWTARHDGGAFDRLNSHLVWLGTHALDIGAMSMFFYCFREREDILRIFEMFSGQRMMTSYIRIGGLALEPPRGWQKVVGKFIRAVPQQGGRVRKSARFESHLEASARKGVGFISLEDMLDLGVTGPMIRAAGMPLGRAQDRAVFELREIRFQGRRRAPKTTCTRDTACVSKKCGRARRSSRRRWKACPKARWQADAPHVVLPDREKMKTQMEALIYHFKIVTEGFRVPAGEVYQCIESPRGEIGYYIVSDGTSKPYRVHMRTPSFANLHGAADDARRTR